MFFANYNFSTKNNYNKFFKKMSKNKCIFGLPQIRTRVLDLVIQTKLEIPWLILQFDSIFCPEQWMTFQQAWLGFSCHTDMWTQILSCHIDTFCNSWPHNFSLSPVNPCSFSHVDSGKKYPSFLTRIFTGIAPMAPLGPGVSSKPNSNPRPGFSPYESHNIQTINTNGELLLGYDGHLGPLVGPTAN